jgi:hypothetical protein
MRVFGRLVTAVRACTGDSAACQVGASLVAVNL